MSYGLRIRNRAGSPVLDIADRISRFRYGTVVSAGVSDKVGLADISGKQSVEFAFLVEHGTNLCQHTIIRSGNGAGTTINWAANSGQYYSSGKSLAFIFLYT